MVSITCPNTPGGPGSDLGGFNADSFRAPMSQQHGQFLVAVADANPVSTRTGACNHCRRMKMRCVGADDPPCKRCRVTGEECVMEKPRKGTSSLDQGGGDE